MTWDEHAAEWDGDEAVRTYAAAAHECLQRLYRDGRLDLDGARILDFGCGTGLLTEQLAERAERVVALDTSTAMVQVLAAKVERHGWLNVDAIAASLGSARQERPNLFALPFDLVVASSVCAFLDDYPGTIVELASLLKPGGVFIQWDWELNREDDESVGLTPSEMSNALAAAQLVDISVETAFEVEVEGETMRPLVGFGRVSSLTVSDEV